jgi:hypothetical protein
VFFLDFNKSLRLFLDQIKEEVAFDVAAVRIVDPLGYIPFVVHDGLADAFFDDECLITPDDCMCGRIIRSDTQADLPFYTEYGSFWTNSLTDLIVRFKKLKGEGRGRCPQEGFETVLIAPIKANNKEATGSLFIASRKKNMLTKKKVDYLENETVRVEKEIFKKMKECDKYINVIRLIAQGRGKDKKYFAKYIDHLINCPSCYNFHLQRVRFDIFIRDSMVRIDPPKELKSKIMQQLH